MWGEGFVGRRMQTKESQTLLIIVLGVSTTTALVMTLQLVQTTEPLATLTAAVPSDFLVDVTDVADIIRSTLEGTSTDAAQECRHLQVATRMRRQFTLGWERLVTLLTLESTRRRRRAGSTELRRPSSARLVGRLARPCRGRRCRWGRRRTEVAVVLTRSSCRRRARLQCKVVSIDGHARSSGVPTIGCVSKSIVGCGGRRRCQRVVSLGTSCDICWRVCTTRRWAVRSNAIGRGSLVLSMVE